MSQQQHTTDIASGQPVWWLIFKREMTDLWIGGRALILLILFTVVMSLTSFLREMESSVSLIPPKEMVFLALEATLAFGLFISLIIGSDAISGERERATLEALLLTPTGRLQIVVGKFLAALSPWPAALLLSTPYLAYMAQGNIAILGKALFWVFLAGTLLAAGFTGFGMLVSSWANSNKTSAFISLLVYILLLIPTQWPWQAQVGSVGDLLQMVNPMEATHHFLEKMLVNNASISRWWNHLVADSIFVATMIGLLFLYAGPRLRLEGGAPKLALPRLRASAFLLMVSAILLVNGMAGSVLRAATFSSVQTAGDTNLEINVDLDHKVVKTGDEVIFNTTLTNKGSTESPAITMAMNIVNVGSHETVDPEDWSPERTQEIEPLAAGTSAELEWQIDTILDGDYMVYITAVPAPSGSDATTQPISSSGIHLTVEAFTRSNPGGVLPLAIGVPLVLTLVTVALRRRWRRGARVDVMSSSSA